MQNNTHSQFSFFQELPHGAKRGAYEKIASKASCSVASVYNRLKGYKIGKMHLRNSIDTAIEEFIQEYKMKEAA